MRNIIPRTWGRSLWLLSPLALIFASILWIDRDLSTWAHDHTVGFGDLDFTASYRGNEIPVTLATLLIAPAEIVSMIYLPCAVVLALFWRYRSPLPRYAWVMLTACITTCVTLAVKERLKWVFGRSWPESWTGTNPSWIRDGAFGFHYFHSGLDYESFPSGHTAAVAAFLMPFWQYYPRCRPIVIAMIGSVAVGLILGNYHFLSDVLAGAYLGIAMSALCTTFIAKP